MRKRRVLNPAFWLGFAVLLLGVTAPAFANILDSVGKQYYDASAGWQSSLIPIARGLFVKLAIIEVLWSAIWWMLERDDPNQVMVSLLKKIMPLMFFWAILLNFDTWIPAVIEGFTKAGQTAGNTGPLTPSTVLDRGLELATAVTEAANKIGLLSGPSGVGKYILAGLSALGILLCFGVIAGQMLVTLIESYIVVSGGVIFLGFAGSRWTTTFAEKFISYAVSVGVKLFVLYLIVGAGQHLSDNWAALLTTDMKVSDYLQILVGAMVYMFLAWQIPSLASSMMTGAVSMTLGSAAATVGTMAAGAAGAAGLAQAGLASGGNSVAGAIQAGNAAIDQAKAGGASSFAGIAGGAAGATASAGFAAAQDTVKGLGAGTTGGNLANRMSEKTASIKEAAAAGAPAALVPGSQPSAPSFSGGTTAATAGQAGAATSATGNSQAASSQETPSEPTRETPPAPTGNTSTAAASATNSAASTPAAAETTNPAPAAPEIPTADNSQATSSQAPAADDGQTGSAQTAPAAGSTESASSQGASPESIRETPAAPTQGTTDSSSPVGTSGAPASSASAGAQPAAPSAANEIQNSPQDKDKTNALQKLSEHVSALGNMPNDSAAGAGVQINLKHD